MKSTGAKVLELESDSGNVVALLQNELRVRTTMVCDKSMSIWYTRLFLVCINGGLARRHAVTLKIEKNRVRKAAWVASRQLGGLRTIRFSHFRERSFSSSAKKRSCFWSFSYRNVTKRFCFP